MVGWMIVSSRDARALCFPEIGPPNARSLLFESFVQAVRDRGLVWGSLGAYRDFGPIVNALLKVWALG